MTLIEITCQIDSLGNLLIPAETIAEMGLRANDFIHAAFLSHDGKTNDYREFLVSKDGIKATEEDDSSFQMPFELLEKANIDADSDLQIACFDGLIVICKSTSLNLDELSEILQRMILARRFADLYSTEDDLSQIKVRLEDTIYYLKGGGERL